MADLSNNTTALIGVAEGQQAIDVIGAVLGPQASSNVMSAIRKVNPALAVKIVEPQDKADAMARVEAAKRQAAASVTFPGSSGSPAPGFLPDFGLFAKNARVTSLLSYKQHKSGRFGRDGTIFTPAGVTQWVTLDPNAAGQLVPGIDTISAGNVLTQLQYAATAGLTQLRLAVAFLGFSIMFRFRNGPTSPTPSGLQITSGMLDEFEQQLKVSFFNNGKRIDYPIYGTEIPTPALRRIYEPDQDGASLIRGQSGFDSYYHCPSPIVLSPAAPFGVIAQGAPADLVATVNQVLDEDDATSSVTFGIMLHWATMASDYDLLKQSYLRGMADPLAKPALE